MLPDSLIDEWGLPAAKLEATGEIFFGPAWSLGNAVESREEINVNESHSRFPPSSDATSDRVFSSAACAEKLQPFFKKLLEFLTAPAFDQHVPRCALRRFLLLKLSSGRPARFVVEKSDFAALLIHPFDGRLGVGIEHDGKSVATIGEVLDGASRRELDSLFSLQACRANARASKRSIGHVDLLACVFHSWMLPFSEHPRSLFEAYSLGPVSRNPMPRNTRVVYYSGGIATQLLGVLVGQTLEPGSLTGRRALVTGSSRGIGADTVRMFAEAGADVVVNFRNKAPRAEKLAAQLRELGVRALVQGADLTDPNSLAEMMTAVREEFGGLDILVLNASGGMESGMGEDYALKLNRDAQLSVLDAALPLLAEGARVVFVTSHQAHFIRTTPTMPEYEPVARSKRAGEDALRERIPALAERGIEFVVVSGDMIEGTVTATLLERANPGAIAERRESAGKLYNVSEFAAEVARAAVEPVPEDHTRLIGDTSSFGAEG